MTWRVGDLVDDLPETRGGARRDRTVGGAVDVARANPRRWVVAMLDERQGARTWIVRRHPELMVATRQLEHNRPGRVTVFVRYDP